MNLPTITDVARAAGVSETTVSLVLNGKAGKYRISPTTQARVSAAIRQLEFHPRQAARDIAHGMSRDAYLAEKADISPQTSDIRPEVTPEPTAQENPIASEPPSGVIEKIPAPAVTEPEPIPPQPEPAPTPVPTPITIESATPDSGADIKPVGEAGSTSSRQAGDPPETPVKADTQTQGGTSAPKSDGVSQQVTEPPVIETVVPANEPAPVMTEPQAVVPTEPEPTVAAPPTPNQPEAEPGSVTEEIPPTAAIDPEPAIETPPPPAPVEKISVPVTEPEPISPQPEPPPTPTSEPVAMEPETPEPVAATKPVGEAADPPEMTEKPDAQVQGGTEAPASDAVFQQAAEPAVVAEVVSSPGEPTPVITEPQAVAPAEPEPTVDVPPTPNQPEAEPEKVEDSSVGPTPPDNL